VPAPHSQLFSTKNINMLIGTASTSAVNTESCRGEMFLVENMLQVTGYWFLVAGWVVYTCKPPSDQLQATSN
ncbi:MAG TPA: hypothetical protein VIV35_05225, partial [Chitinophagaceae bacterium]